MTKGENFDIGGEIWESKGINENFEHTSRGSKLINLYGTFECAFHIFVCMAQVLNFNIHACVVYANCRFEWWNKKLASIGWVTRLVFILWKLDPWF